MLVRRSKLRSLSFLIDYISAKSHQIVTFNNRFFPIDKRKYLRDKKTTYNAEEQIDCKTKQPHQ